MRFGPHDSSSAPRASPRAGASGRLAATLHLVEDLPALLLASGMFGDFLGGLLIVASIISMLEFKFEFEGSPKKRSKK